MLRFMLIGLIVFAATTAEATKLPETITQAKRIAFLGDSITDAGHYISIIEYHLRMLRLKRMPELINLGLPSETCSGLSEPDHPFPRPNVHERIDRALARVKPDVVVACYGMNDGIYYPFSKKRFLAYQDGVKKIITKVRKSGAKLILMTPPAFDPLPLKKKGKLRPAGSKKYAWFAIYAGYDDVLARYAKWVMTIRQDVSAVIDLHTPVNKQLKAKRKSNPDYVMSGDGVHVNLDGHKVLARAILTKCGIKVRSKTNSTVFKLISQRQSMLHAAWLSHVGHKRPGVKAGLPIKEAQQRAKVLEEKIQEALRSNE